jgi:hypothetical protein
VLRSCGFSQVRRASKRMWVACQAMREKALVGWGGPSNEALQQTKRGYHAGSCPSHPWRHWVALCS